MNTLQQFKLVLVAVSTMAASTQALSDDLFDKHDNQKNYSIVTPLQDANTSNSLVRSCESTARGIRCKNNTNLTADFIAKLEHQGNSRYQTTAEKSCNNSSRGTRCMRQTKLISPIYIASVQQLTARANSCQTKSRGSRCFS